MPTDLLKSAFLRTLAALLCAALAAVPDGHANATDVAKLDRVRPELAYLKLVNGWRPPADPQLVYLLMGQFANANRHAEGAAFFDALRRRFDAQLSDPQRAVYLTAIGSLRAGHANQVGLIKRYGWVRDTLHMLDEAKRLTHGEGFAMRWMSGLVRAQLPAFFGEREVALADLTWCTTHAELAPQPGWLREVHFHLAMLQRQLGNVQEAQRQRSLSGYLADTKPAIFTTPFSGGWGAGHHFSARTVREPVPGTVYTLSGFEFTEYHFVVSADRRELIAIDAGTRPDAAREALEALRTLHPGLPPLTTVFVTHAHWDHVGGQRYFRGLKPAPRFVGRGNYADELALDARADPALLKRFFGERFQLADVLAYKPDVAIDQPTEMTIGGTRFALWPTRGGETGDALLIHLPDHGVVFVGDILMPYLGAPFIEEGSVEGLLAGIDQVLALQPRLLLHGHEPLTRLFDSTAMLADLRVQLAWLRDQVGAGMAAGQTRAALQQANLVPPTLAQSPSAVHLAYLVLRENLINRVFDQGSGYWQNGLQGLDALSDADHGAALVDYLGLDEARILDATEHMVADGRHELAAATLRWAQARLPASPRGCQVRELVYLKLMEKYQEFNPFKFILYAAQIGQATAQMPPRPADRFSARPVSEAGSAPSGGSRTASAIGTCGPDRYPGTPSLVARSQP
jgi:glyoxylase-like metal-dependent hydrolase (beta-lactamase superfamily II)